MSQRKDDIELLRKTIAGLQKARSRADEAEADGVANAWDEAEKLQKHIEAFESMLARLIGNPQLELTERQRAYVGGVSEETLDEVFYTNAWSAGQVPRGLPKQATPTPKVLQQPLPKKPPKRKVEE